MMDEEIMQKDTMHLNYLNNRFMFIGFLGHFLWIFLFLGLGIYLISFINFLSASIYIIGLFLNKKGYTFMGIAIGHIEILIHAIVITVLLGPHMGFQYYILDTIIVTFIASKPKLRIKSFILLIDLSLFTYLTQYPFSPIYQVSMVIENSLLLMNIITLCITLAIVTHYFQKTTHLAELNLIQLNKKLGVLANTDSLTNLINRRTMFNILQREQENYRSTQKPFTITIADIDNFKEFNDKNGHACGDFVLQECSKLLKDCLKDNDYISRWGGEEFLFLIHDVTLHEAYDVIESIRLQLEKKTFFYQGASLKISLTFGLTEYNEQCSDILSCINNADQALIQGKKYGKNCIVIYNNKNEIIKEEIYG